MVKLMSVNGMMCNHCKMTVENALKAVEGVADAVADLEAKQVTVTLSAPVEDAVLCAAVTEEDFEVAGIQTK